jgi:thiol-disulfide isomerase/thioredoxin
MKWLYSLVFLFVFNVSFGQSVSVDSNQVPYLQDKKLPFFKIMQTDSSLFYKSDLKKRTSTVIVYFSPDCEHCQKFTELLTKKIDEFKKTQFVMVSPFPMTKIKEFYDQYHIKDYSSIIMGHDALYFFGTYFHARFIPFVAAYDKKGNLIRGWEGGITIDELQKALK